MRSSSPCTPWERSRNSSTAPGLCNTTAPVSNGQPGRALGALMTQLVRRGLLGLAAVGLTVASGVAAGATHTQYRAAGAGAAPREAACGPPPPQARPRVWWHWMNGNVTKDGIAKDLQWMKRMG